MRHFASISWQHDNVFDRVKGATTIDVTDDGRLGAEVVIIRGPSSAPTLDQLMHPGDGTDRLA